MDAKWYFVVDLIFIWLAANSVEHPTCLLGIRVPVCLRWRNVYLDPLPSSKKMDYLFSTELKEFFIYSR